MKIAVVGAGLMGRAAVYDLVVNPDVKKIGVFDIDLNLAKEVGKKYGHGKTVCKKFDAGNIREAAKLFNQYDAVVSAVTYKYNPGLAKAAIKAKAHFFDLGGNNSAVDQEFKLTGAARKAGVVVIPDCGLAPGMVSIITAGHVSKFDKPESVEIRVGGLPQKPKPPLNYQIAFSSEGLINEYYEPVVAIKNRKKVTVPPMTEVESLSFKGIGKLEAFTTSGGTSTLPKTYGKILKNLNYKTIRYPGHCHLFKMMMDIGLCEWDKVSADGVKVSPRSVLKQVLDNNLNYGEPDMILLRVTTEGKIKGKKKKYISEFVDKYDKKTGLTSMMRCTAFAITIIAWMACAGHIKKRGVVPQEKAIDPDLFTKELLKRKIMLKSRWAM